MTAIIIEDIILFVCILLLAFGFLHEDKVAAWERRAAAKIKKRVLQLITKIRRRVYGKVLSLSELWGKSRF